MDSLNNGNRVMTIREVSDFLKIPLSTVYLLVKGGRLPGVKLGRHWRFMESDIVDFIHAGSLKSQVSGLPIEGGAV